MWRDNATWGENMICGELTKLGYRVSPRTVAKYRPSGLARGRWSGELVDPQTGDEVWGMRLSIPVHGTPIE
jgi:hypothetical protein